jgi:hypothetical protein
LSTESSALTVTTGLPASAGFSIAVGSPSYAASGLACPNVEAYGTDGVTVPITVRLSDRYNNPVPDGTSIVFNTDGGHIVGSCTTPSAPTSPGDGTCSATWTSANPRPQLAEDTPPLLAAGRAKVLATAIGEESFTDVNGSGFWQAGDPFANLGEPYRDDNENGQYDHGEYFLDYNQNGVWDAGNGSFVGITCTGTTAGSTCTTAELAIGAQQLVIMSTSAANISVTGTTGFGGTVGSGLDYRLCHIQCTGSEYQPDAGRHHHRRHRGHGHRHDQRHGGLVHHRLPQCGRWRYAQRDPDRGDDCGCVR